MEKGSFEVYQGR